MQSDTYSNGYFNIQDIMASQERVSCKFEIDVVNMGNSVIFQIFPMQMHHLKITK